MTSTTSNFKFSQTQVEVVFYIQTESKNDITKVEVFNMMGQSIPVNYELNKQFMEINLETATSGLLLLKVSSNKRVSTKRILIQQ